jgi:hypothetical protein
MMLGDSDPAGDVYERLEAAGLVDERVAEINAVDRLDGATYAEIIMRPDRREEFEPRIRGALVGCDFEILDDDRRRARILRGPPPSGTSWFAGRRDRCIRRKIVRRLAQKA